MPVQLKIHQALFGYDGGHHLLNASVHLPTELRQLLAVATDLSGSAPAQGFDVSYTGFSLPGSTYYALFCTWLALEMPRPGCVWSQVLLIELADLAEVADLGLLRSLFRRPHRDDFAAYGSPLLFNSGAKTATEPSVDRELAATVLYALYGTPERSVVLPVNEERETEQVVFGIWSQQWPKLRRSFRFSTGSFSDRSRNLMRFDLQVTPFSNRSAWRAETASILPLQTRGELQDVGKRQDWLRLAIDDLIQPNSGGLRSFCRKYAMDVNGLRDAFVRLSRAFLLLQSNHSNERRDRFTGIATLFPDRKEALALKQSSLSPDEEMGRDALIQCKWSALEFIYKQPVDGPYSELSFDLAEAASFLWRHRRRDLLDLLSEAPTQPNTKRWEAVAQGIAEVMSAGELAALSERHSAFIVPFVSFKPVLATYVEPWQTSERTQWLVVEALERLRLTSVDWKAITYAMLTAKTYVGVKEVIRADSTAAFQSSMNWIFQSSAAAFPSSIWKEALQPIAVKRVESAILSSEELAYCVWLNPTETTLRISPERGDVLGLASVDLRKFPEQICLSSAFFLVTLALRSEAEGGARMLAQSFSIVYRALAEQREPGEAWRLLKPMLPYLWLWEWDHCEKLRKGVLEWLRQHPAARGYLRGNSASSSDPSQLSNLLYS